MSYWDRMKYWDLFSIAFLSLSIVLKITIDIIRFYFIDFLPTNSYTINSILVLGQSLAFNIGLGLLMIGILQHQEIDINYTDRLHKLAKTGFVYVVLSIVVTFLFFIPILSIIILISFILLLLVILYHTYKLQTFSSETMQIKKLLASGFGFPIIVGLIGFILSSLPGKEHMIDLSSYPFFIILTTMMLIVDEIIFMVLVFKLRSFRLVDTDEDLLYKKPQAQK